MKTVLIQKNGVRICEAMHANNYFLRLRGLLGRTLQDGQGLLLTPCGEIHTCGMRYPIDAVYLARDGAVLKVDPAPPAGKFFKPVRGAYRVLELPAHAAEAAGLAAGDRVEVV